MLRLPAPSNRVISEKVDRRLMAEEQLGVKRTSGHLNLATTDASAHNKDYVKFSKIKDINHKVTL